MLIGLLETASNTCDSGEVSNLGSLTRFLFPLTRYAITIVWTPNFKFVGRSVWDYFHAIKTWV